MRKPVLPDDQAAQKAVLSMGAVFFVCIIIIWQMFAGSMPNLHTWDLFGSYVYLPMVFEKHQLVYHDIEWMDSVRQQYDLSPTLYQITQWQNGNIITRNTCGWAILMLPFYLIAECWAGISGYPTDGFSYPYQFMTVTGAVIYSVAGFLFLRKVLLHFFSDKISTITILLLVFGTNLLFTQFASAGSTNNVEFFLIAAMLYFTIRFHEKHSTLNAVLLALSLALIGLVRPPDLVVGLIPVFWLSNGGNVIVKIRFLIQNHKTQLIAGMLVIGLLGSLQLAYWKVTTGEFLINSYNNAGEGFDWFDPHLKQLLFSYRKGWFLYTPLMIFALIGLIIWARKKPSGIISFISVLAFIYVASTWTNWWYAGSFSQRSLIDIYAILAVGLGFFLTANLNPSLKYASSGLIALLVVLNLFQTWQFKNGIIHSSSMTRKYYWSVFGQTSQPTPDQLSLLLPEEEIYRKWNQADEKDYKRFYSEEIKFKAPFELKEGVEFGPVATVDQKKTSYKDLIWMKAVWKYEGSSSGLKGKQFTWNAVRKNVAYGWRGGTVEDPVLIIDTIAHTVTNSYFVAHLRSKDDILSTSVWNQDQASPPLRIISLTIEAYGLRDPDKYR